ncbi:MAG TPA: DUF5320 domain-containing protein [Syntrophales bacterium]|nr:DUF5320 domain-containing protein [Syntrophales bacterium]HOL59931.1 DUF5320 domain-containing protein [Syntrophales bacterium]HPO36249.1 DUF5320 domain-containing protein [Syntrophales bacterium]
MPRGDRTGPWGLGPMTGRAAGFCAGYGMPGYANPAVGRGWGLGFGRGFRGGGFGWRYRFYATGIPGRYWWGFPPAPTYDAKTEKQLLEGQLNFFQEEIKALKKRLAELSGEKETEP